MAFYLDRLVEGQHPGAGIQVVQEVFIVPGGDHQHSIVCWCIIVDPSFNRDPSALFTPQAFPIAHTMQVDPGVLVAKRKYQQVVSYPGHLAQLPFGRYRFVPDLFAGMHIIGPVLRRIGDHGFAGAAKS